MLNDYGEEYAIKNGLEATLSVLLFLNDPDEGGDGLSDSDDLAAITTEPDESGTYARQSEVFSYEVVGGDAASTNDAEVAFDYSGNDEDVDSYGLVISFQSDRAGDGAAQDHLIGWGSLGQTITGADTAQIPLEASEIGASLD